MKVVQVLYSGLGGHGSVAFSLAAAAAGDWRSELIFFGIEPLLPEYERLCRERGIAFQYVAMTQGRAWDSWSALYAALSRAAPQAVILHSVKGILPSWLYACRRGARLVAVEHQPNHLKARSEWIVSHLLMLLADSVVVLTPGYETSLRAALGPAFRKSKVRVIPNGLDLSTFSRTGQDSARNGRPLRVGMAARFTTTKRQDLLVDALSALTRRDPANAWTLSLAGTGDNLAEVKRRAEAAGLSDTVEFPGYLGEADLRDWFAGLDVYAHASTGETLSTSLLQAMAMELPIVGSDVAGISNLLARGGGCGICAPAQSGEAFADALLELQRDPVRAQALARAARRLAETEYSATAMFSAYRELVGRT